jgi:hypothetical protein
MKDYIQSKTGLGLAVSDVLDLFNSDLSAAEQLRDISLFLREQIKIASNTERVITDVLVYYVGHGSFLESSTEFFMVVKNADISYDTECLMARSLARHIRADAPSLRQFVILDCCFSGAAHRAWQSTTASDVAVRAVAEAAPDSGAVFLCSSAEDLYSMAPDGAEHTMFSGALLTALRTGSATFQGDLSARLARDLAWEQMKRQYGTVKAVRPVVHGLDRGGGDISEYPAFPNPRRRAPSKLTKRERELARKVDRAVNPRNIAIAELTNIDAVWRDWFEEDEVVLAVVLSEWFDPDTEHIKKMTARLIYGKDDDQHWLVVSSERLYLVLDRLDLVEPLVDWSLDLSDEFKGLATAPIYLVEETRELITLKVGTRKIAVGREAFYPAGILQQFHEWLTDHLGDNPPNDKQIARCQGDLEVLQRVRHYIYDPSIELGGGLVQVLEHEISNMAARWVMYLVRMHRRDPRLAEPEAFRLRPILDALCRRSGDRFVHRYHAQLAYLLWCVSPSDYMERVRLLGLAIKYRERSADKGRFRRYELTRAVSRIRADEGFSRKRNKKRSSDDAKEQIARDLEAANSLVRKNRIGETSFEDVEAWCKLNRVPVPR